MSFVAPLRAELYRLLRSRAGRWGVAVPALLAAAQVLGMEWLARLEAARRGVAADAPAEPAFGPLADGLGGLGAMALVMIALLTGAFSVARERDLGGLPLLALARPRSAIVLGKALGVCAYVLTAFVAMLLASAAAAALGHDFTGVVEEGFEMASAGELGLETLRAIGAGLPAVLCCVAFGVLVSSACSTAASAAVGAVVPFTLLALFQSTLGNFADRVFVTYAPFFSEQAPLARLSQVSRAFSDAHWAPGELTQAAVVPTVQAAAFLLLACLLTRTREA